MLSKTLFGFSAETMRLKKRPEISEEKSLTGGFAGPDS
jgi:hypothetical protein